MEAGPYRNGRTPIPVTASAGVASVRPSDRALATVVQRADAGLHAAKRDGRDRVGTLAGFSAGARPGRRSPGLEGKFDSST